MKKALSLILSLIMILSAMGLTAFAAEKPLTITVANDLHLDVEDSFADSVKKRNSASVEYAHVSSGGQMIYESYALVRAFLENAAQNESDFVIMPGDITNNGLVAEHEFLADMLGEFESTTGKKVFVVAGNHDYLKTSVTEFEKIYAEFGYNEAYANDPNSGTYMAELSDGYVLLAIDSSGPSNLHNAVTGARFDWIEAQLKQAKAQGKKVIAMSHYNVMEHFILQAKIHTGSVLTPTDFSLASMLADNGVKFIFSAHTHSHDIAMHTSDAGNVIYEAVTNSLSQYPCAYRVVSFGESVVFRTDYVRSIDTTLLPDGIHETAFALAESNFLLYAKNCTYLGVRNMIVSYTKASQLKKILNTDDETVNGVIDRAAGKLEEIADMPIYKADAAESEPSLEAMAEELGIDIFESDYETLIDLIVCVYQKKVEGDETMAAYSDEMVLVSRLLAVAINYAFSDVTNEEFTYVLSFVASLLGVDISKDIIDAVGSNFDKFRGAELFVTSVALPLLGEFGKDSTPKDKNVTLPGYDSAPVEESLLDKIRAFFKGIFDFFHMLFAMIA